MKKILMKLSYYLRKYAIGKHTYPKNNPPKQGPCPDIWHDKPNRKWYNKYFS